jgi:hypothetical protein
MSHFCESISKEKVNQMEAGIHLAHHIPATSPPHHVNVEYLLHSRACCKLLLLWSIITTLASMISVYYAIDVHNSLVLKKELTNVILSRDFPIVKQGGFQGFQRPR